MKGVGLGVVGTEIGLGLCIRTAAKLANRIRRLGFDVDIRSAA